MKILTCLFKVTSDSDVALDKSTACQESVICVWLFS